MLALLLNVIGHYNSLVRNHIAIVSTCVILKGMFIKKSGRDWKGVIHLKFARPNNYYGFPSIEEHCMNLGKQTLCLNALCWLKPNLLDFIRKTKKLLHENSFRSDAFPFAEQYFDKTIILTNFSYFFRWRLWLTMHYLR